MKKFAFITLVAVTSFANAQDIPKAFQGKWAGDYHVLQPFQIKSICNGKEDSDISMTMTVTKDKILLTQFEKNETIENFKFNKTNKNFFKATAKVTEVGGVTDQNGDLTTDKLIYTRNVEFSLDKDGLLELYKDNLKDRPRTDPRFWYKCSN